MNKDFKKSNFAAAFLFLNSKKRYALSIIYSFMRNADDCVDIKKNKNYIDELRHKISDLYLGRRVDDLLLKQLKEVIDEYKIPQHTFIELLRGLEKDTQNIDIKTLHELEDYMYCVAGTVGEIILKIVDYKGKDAQEIATLTGYAVQMTNILRDIKEDLESNKIYIPLEHRMHFLKSHRISLQSMGFKELFDFEKDIAISYYTKSDELFAKNKTKELFVPSLMKNLYREMLYELNFNNLEKNHKISKYKKLKAFLTSLREIY